jgi:arylsulfatase A-like enzyme
VDSGSFYPHGKLHLGYKTYLERLRDDAGYEIGYCGKWHLGCGALHARGIHNVRASDGGEPQRGAAWPRVPPPDLDGETLEPYYGSFTQGVSHDQARIELALEQLEGLARGRGPFCAFISTHGPHFPHYVPKRFAGLYAELPADFAPANYCAPFVEPNKPAMQSRPYWPCQRTQSLTPDQWRKTCQHYWAYCTHLDEQFGRVLAKHLLPPGAYVDGRGVEEQHDHWVGRAKR